MFLRYGFFVYVGEQDSIVEELRSAMGSRDPMVRKTAVYFYLLYLFEHGRSRDALAIMDAHRQSIVLAEKVRPFVLADSPGGKPLALKACKDMARKGYYGWEWAYGQSALSLLGQSDDLAAAAGDFQRRTQRFPCRAHYFLGISKLGRGDRPGARQEFRAAAATGVFSFWTWHMRKIMLARLENDPAWPPWIPMAAGARRQ
jgi:hypothetical protein